MANKLSHFIVQDFVLNQFVQDFTHWRLVHQQNVILGQSLVIFTLHGIGLSKIQNTKDDSLTRYIVGTRT